MRKPIREELFVAEASRSKAPITELSEEEMAKIMGGVSRDHGTIARAEEPRPLRAKRRWWPW